METWENPKIQKYEVFHLKAIQKLLDFQNSPTLGPIVEKSSSRKIHYVQNQQRNPQLEN